MFIEMFDRRRRKDYTVIRLGEPGDVVPMKKTKNEISQSMPVQLIVKGISEKHNKKYQIT